jgi:hypothetical protein
MISIVMPSFLPKKGVCTRDSLIITKHLTSTQTLKEIFGEISHNITKAEKAKGAEEKKTEQ